MTIAFLLICVAVLVLGSAHLPTPHGWIAVVFAALAIVAYFAGGHIGLRL